ncbi:MAG: M24 family metallopeptidase [bacterium]
MKKEIDKLMKKMKISAIYAEGKSTSSPTMYYLLNGSNFYGHYVKKQGKRACVVHYPIEREVAKESGHRLINATSYGLRKIYEKYPDQLKAKAYFIKAILDDNSVKGNVAFYGQNQMGGAYNLLKQLLRIDKKVKVCYESSKSLITTARETKDANEVERIESVGRRVVRAFNNMLKHVQQLKVKKNVVMKDRKRKLLIGDLRQMLRKSMFEDGLINSDGMIVAQGRDAGVPHNSGNDRSVVKLGQTIVFDIFPREIGGGYFFDFTRTICFGHASKEIRDVYSTVRDAQDVVIDMFKVGKRNIEIERSLCKFFEKRGHPTLLNSPKTQHGYCHTLGHGVGLNIHESPSFGLIKTNKDRIKTGHVFTVEPGLYYPDKGYGVRLEDIVHINSRGKVIPLTKCSRRLVVEI